MTNPVGAIGTPGRTFSQVKRHFFYYTFCVREPAAWLRYCLKIVIRKQTADRGRKYLRVSGDQESDKYISAAAATS